MCVLHEQLRLFFECQVIGWPVIANRVSKWVIYACAEAAECTFDIKKVSIGILYFQKHILLQKECLEKYPKESLFDIQIGKLLFWRNIGPTKMFSFK